MRKPSHLHDGNFEARFYAGHVNEIYPEVIADIVYGGKEISVRPESPAAGANKELHPVFFEIPRPEMRLVTSYGREVNVAFALAEVVWILLGRNDVRFLEPFNSNIAQFSDDGMTFNAPYGYRMRQAHGYDQLRDTIKLLNVDRNSRQGVITIWHPDDRAFEEPNSIKSRETKDRACNVVAHAMIRDDKLDWLQVIRSNDAIWGLPYNWMQWTNIQEWMATQVGAKIGKFCQVSDSLHIYQRHLEGAKGIRYFDIYRYFQHVPIDVSQSELETLGRLIEGSKDSAGYDFSSSWARSVANICTSYIEYKKKRDLAAYQYLLRCPDRAYAAAQLRFFWTMRWHKDDYKDLGWSIDYDWPLDVSAWIKFDPTKQPK